LISDCGRVVVVHKNFFQSTIHQLPGSSGGFIFICVYNFLAITLL